MRKYAREVCLDLIFEYQFNAAERTSLDEELFDKSKLTAEDEAFVFDLYRGVLSHWEELKETVGKYAKGYSVTRIYRVDLAILMMAAYEIQYTETGAAIIANEAVELAKRFSAENSVPFVNGVLAAMIREKNV